MKKTILLGFLPLILFFNLKKTFAQEEKSLLWEVSGNGLESSSYLFGTIHIICPDDYFWNDAFENAFAQTEQLFLEVDMSNPDVMKKMQEVMTTTSDEDWVSKLGQKEKDLITEAISNMAGVPKDMISDEMLEQISLMGVYQLMMLSNLECSLPDSYDLNILKKAQTAQMDIKGLEEVSLQIELLQSMDTESVLEAISNYSEEDSDGNDTFEQLINAYKSQDIELLYKLMSDSPEMAGMEKALLTDRNHSWIPVMKEAMKEKPAFFAFGAGHLPGADGIIQLLRKEGYTVKAVK